LKRPWDSSKSSSPDMESKNYHLTTKNSWGLNVGCCKHNQLMLQPSGHNLCYEPISRPLFLFDALITIITLIIKLKAKMMWILGRIEALDQVDFELLLFQKNMQ
jgi:hypothetical protein